MKERITITVDKDLLEWIDNKIARKVFANRSHALEVLALTAIQEEEGFSQSHYHSNTAKEDLHG